MADMTIREAAAAVENGHACAFREQLGAIPFPQNLMFMQQIAAQTVHDHAANKHLPALNYEVSGVNVTGSLYTSKWFGWSTQTVLADELFTEEGQRGNVGTRSVSCTDTTKT